MGLIDNILGAFSSKEPSFPVTEQPSWNDYSDRLLNSDAYLDQFFGYTYRAAKLRADAVVNAQIKLIKNDEEVDEKDQLWKDLHRFNAYQTLDDARRLTEIHRALAGMAIWLITTVEDNPNYRYEFYILNPLKVKPIANEFGLPIAYEYQDVKGQRHRIPDEDVIVFREPNPSNWLSGISPLQAARFSHNTWELASKFNMNMFGNSGRPDGLLIAEGASEENRKLLEKKLRQKYGGVENAKKVGVINRVVQWLEMTKTQKELDYVAGMKLTRDDILSIFGVPSVLVDAASSTFSNLAEAQRVFQMYTIKPQLQIEVSTYNEQLLRKYFTTESARNGYKFTFDDPVEKDRTALITETTTLWNNNLIEFNEARERIGFDPVDELNGSYIRDVVQTPQQELLAQLRVDNAKTLKAVKHTHKAVKELKVDTKEGLTEEQRMREGLRMKFHIKGVEEEKQYIQPLNGFFMNQMLRVLGQLEGKEKVSMDVMFDVDTEAEKLTAVVTPITESIVNQSILDADSMTPSETLKGLREKQLTPEAAANLKRSINASMTEINATTKKQIFNIISESVKTGRSIQETGQLIAAAYDSFMFGNNAAVLKGYGVYIDTVTITNSGGVVVASGNRYNRMFELITSKLTGADQKQAAQALLNICNSVNDPIAIQMRSTIPTLISGLDTELGTGGLGSRANTIARTETFRARNQAMQDRYGQNEFVESTEWLSSRDAFTRLTHLDADGQVRPLGKKFQVGGSNLLYPGDPSGSAEETINCRCITLPVINI